jgi:hypothetical protein
VLCAILPVMTIASTPTPSGPGSPVPATAPSSSGIEGVVLVSPTRPGPITKDTPTSAPAPNVTFVVMKGSEKVSSLTTDAEGRFRIFLPPGQYTVLRDDPGARIGHWRFEAEVKAGEMTAVRWVGDSGMR